MSEEKLVNNRYQIEELLGRGGMAVVYHARDITLERDVALKVLKADYTEDPAFRERFRQEAKAAANLTHPNIVTVYDFGYDRSRLYIVMEYVPGDDLNSMINERGRLALDDGLTLAIKACKGIGYAHRAGLVHCDVKPHNLLVTPDMQLKVTDFGIARALASINPEEEVDVVWGSPQYFSPEQAGGEPPSPASDVYSLGVVMYLMFTGQLPFIGKTAAELARLHRRADPIPPRELNPFLPEDLEEVLLKVLAKESSARYRTADQLGRVLQMIAKRVTGSAGQGSTIRPAARPAGSGPRTTTNDQQLSDTTPVESKQSHPEEETEPGEVDWLGVLVGLLAVTAVGGLIPFWIWIYNRIF